MKMRLQDLSVVKVNSEIKLTMNLIAGSPEPGNASG